MSRASVGSGFQTKLEAGATSPGYLIEIAFATTLRFSTRGTITISGTTWTPRSFTVSGMPRPTFTFPDSDNLFSALLLTEGISGKQIKLWKFDGDTPSSTEYSHIQTYQGDNFSLNARSAIIKTVIAGEDAVREPNLRVVRNSVRAQIALPNTRVYFDGDFYTFK